MTLPHVKLTHTHTHTLTLTRTTNVFYGKHTPAVRSLACTVGGCEEIKYNEITSYTQKRKFAIVVVVMTHADNIWLLPWNVSIKSDINRNSSLMK